MRIRDCLRKAPVTVPPHCSSKEAAALMVGHGVGALLVVQAGELVGIVTDRDLVARGVALGRPPGTAVEELMTVSPVTVQGSEDVDRAFELFREGGFRRLPVLEDEELAGILTVDDVLLGAVARLQSALEPVAREAGLGHAV